MSSEMSPKVEITQASCHSPASLSGAQVALSVALRGLYWKVSGNIVCARESEDGDWVEVVNGTMVCGPCEVATVELAVQLRKRVQSMLDALEFDLGTEQ